MSDGSSNVNGVRLRESMGVPDAPPLPVTRPGGGTAGVGSVLMLVAFSAGLLAGGALTGSPLQEQSRAAAVGHSVLPPAPVCNTTAAWDHAGLRVSPAFARNVTWPLFDAVRGAMCAHASPRSARTLERIVARMAAARSYSVVAVGGSSTSGSDCVNELVEFATCAWPGRLVDSLRAVFSSTAFSYANFASGGMNSVAAVGSIPFWLTNPPDSDLLLVDFHVNDIFGTPFPDDVLLEAVESLAAAVERRRPDLDVLFMASVARVEARASAAIVQLVGARHGFPVFSYFDLVDAVHAVRPRGGDVPLDTPASAPALGEAPWWVVAPNSLHPTWAVHQLIADAARGCLADAWAALCDAARAPAPIAVPERLALPCDTFISVSDAATHWRAVMGAASGAIGPADAATAAAEPGAPRAASHWALAADRRNKPGWISDAMGAWIEFDVEFGEHPRLGISYLQSYETLGTARLSLLSRPGQAVSLDGIYLATDPQLVARVSVTKYLVLEVESPNWQPHLVLSGRPQGTAGALGLSIPPFSRDVLRFEIVTSERNESWTTFKLLSVSTC